MTTVKSRINDFVKTVAKVVIIIQGEIDLSLKTVVLFFFVFFFKRSTDDFHGILMTDDCPRLEYAYGLSRSLFQVFLR
jgi:hypothetical protein